MIADDTKNVFDFDKFCKAFIEFRSFEASFKNRISICGGFCSF